VPGILEKIMDGNLEYRPRNRLSNKEGPRS